MLNDDDRFGTLLRVHRDIVDAIREAARRRIRSGAVADGADDIAVFLEMGRDSADGVIEFLPFTHDVRVTWNVKRNLPLYDTEQLCEDVAGALGGTAAYSPLWQRLRLPVAVHNLGGCVMADDPRKGVTDSNSEVYGTRICTSSTVGVCPARPA